MGIYHAPDKKFLRDEIIQQAFHQISALIRSSPPVDEDGNKILVSDNVRLKLYGYYKVATSASDNHGDLQDVHSTPRPSFFDPVGRAKYDAWLACSYECDGDFVEGMKRYAQVAASQDGSAVGRECALIYHDMLTSLQRLEDEKETSNEVAGEGKERENGEKSSTEFTNNTTVGDCQLLIEEKEANPEPFNNTSAGPTISSRLSFLPTLLPRGQLDISLLDLLYALFRCAQYAMYNLFLGGGMIHNILSRFLPSFFITLLSILFGSFHPQEREEWYEKEIIKMAKMLDNSNTPHDAGENCCAEVVVGLSVRSLLDLYLSVRSFPKGSEVVIVPGISIQGMVDVMEFHYLNLVPVDLPTTAKSCANETAQSEPSEETNTNDNPNVADATKRDLDFCAKSLWGIDLQMVKAAVSAKTVAILVVHPFGALIADDVIMRKLRDMADDSGLEIWEDCAQCYTGKSFGSTLANASFFSFGPIKTSTALGGALTLLRNHPTAGLTQQRKELTTQCPNMMEYSESMKRIQKTIYIQQSNISFSIRVLKCLVFQLLSNSVIASGIAKVVIELLGWDYDDFVVAALRGFSAGNNSSMECSLRRTELINQLRCRPCAAMLALLYQRLKASDMTMRGSIARRNRCSAFERRLVTNLQRNVLIPRKLNGSGMNGWIFPVLVEDPRRTSKYLLDMGIDAPSGLTQLKPVRPDQCPRTRAVFNHILYLPVTGHNFSSDYQNRLVKALKEGVLTIEKKSKSKTKPSSQAGRRSVSTIMLAVFVQWYFVDRCYSTPLKMILNTSIRLAQWMVSAVVCVIILLGILSQYMGPVYIESSNTFSKYCDMLFQSPFDVDCKKEDNSNFLQSKTVLTMDSTDIPKVGSAVEDDESRICLVTGATGFIGSLLLRELLLHRRSLGIAGVAVIVRARRGKTAVERIQDLLSRSMFDFLSEVEKSILVHVIEGDVTLPDCGLTKPQLASMCGLNISHVFHCAAAVSFSQSLEDAAVSNITSSLQMQKLTKDLHYKKAQFVYISTAFVHGGSTGTSSEPLQDRLFTLDPYDPWELYKSMIGTQSYASAAMNALGFPNTYTFSKCICEHLLHSEQSVDTIIFRPSIVGPSVQEPYEGWAGDKPSTIVAAACLYLKFPYNMWCFGKKLVPFVPVDVVCRVILSKTLKNRNTPLVQCVDSPSFESYVEEKKETNSYDTNENFRRQPTITTIAWDSSSSNRASFSWVSYAFAITHLGSVCGHVDRIVAYAGLLLSTKIFPWFDFQYTTFQRLHLLFVRAPIDTLLHLYQRIHKNSRFSRDVKVLSPILDLPMLFFPFANQNFYFKSNLVAPSDFNGERYMFSCAVAAHRFISNLEKERGRQHNHKTNLKVCDENTIASLVVAGSNHNKPASDLLWALTQPKGNLFIRLGGFVLSKIFRHTANEIEIDAASFVELARMISESSTNDRHHVIIAPTHRSLYDFLIISYVCFSYPELGIDVPFIAAADDFRDVPIVGWLASGAQAFFLKRGRNRADPSLRRDLDIIIKSGRTHSFIEVFIEGKRSRFRTFSRPRTGFMRCLAETNQKFLVLPLTINYEALPDQTSLMEQACRDNARRLRLTDLLHWLRRALSRSVSIGRVFVSASGVLEMPKSETISSLCHEIQRRHQNRIIVSRFHIEAASLSLGIKEELILEALGDLHVKVWPQFSEISNELSLPQSLDLRWAAMLHFGHFFAPFLSSSLPMWSAWLSPSGASLSGSGHSSEAVKIVVAKLVEYFEAAEDAVQESVSKLQLNGFPNPEEEHIMQYLSENPKIPLFLMRAATQIRCFSKKQNPKTYQIEKSNLKMFENSSMTQPLFHPSIRCSNPDSESLGAWGYQDSYFVLNVGPDGSKNVVMKGKRYNISGKTLPNLATFIEDELDVKIDPSSITFPAIEKLNLDADTPFTVVDLSDIAALFGTGMSQVSTKPHDRARHGTGHTQEDMYRLRSGSPGFRFPDVVVWPGNEREVSLLVALATAKNWCLIPFGGGTNVTHATHCPERLRDPRPMISVDMKLMNQVIWVNQEDGLACVEAGITGRQLIEHMDKLGFTIGHEPDSYEFSTLGGWIATKASGMKQNRYGNIEDIVKEVTVVGVNGVASNVHTTEKISFGRVSTGVDFKSIMLGSEGCLGIVVSAVVKIWPKAEVTSHESVLLPDLDTGLRFAKAISKMRTMKPASVRLLDNDQFRLGQALQEESSRFDRLKKSLSKHIAYYYGKLSEKSVVCATITFEGSFSEVQIQRRIVRDVAASHCGILAGPGVGKAGYDLTFAIAYLRDFALNYNLLGESFETFVPWSKLKRVIQATKNRIQFEHKKRALPGVPFVCCRITQLYDEGACVYFYFCMSINNISDPSTTFSSIEECARQEILNAGGSLSHHHGLGKLRAPFVRQIYSDGYVNSVIAVKKALDPSNIFGAGNGVLFRHHG
ncbi:hypothetical protein ACHAW6_010012 [Cyclotella cf. meneghiniana]